MDINAALFNLRASVASYRRAESIGDTDGMADASADMAEATEAIDGWMSKAGFMPDAWNINR